MLPILSQLFLEILFSKMQHFIFSILDCITRFNDSSKENDDLFFLIRIVRYNLGIARIKSEFWNIEMLTLLPLPEKKRLTLQLWLNEIKRADWTYLRLQAAHTYQKRFNKVLSFVIMGASKDFLWISVGYVEYEMMSVHVCKTTNWRFICLIMCNWICIVMSNWGCNNKVAVKIVACWNLNIYYIFMTRKLTVSLSFTLDVSHSTGGNPVRSSILWVSRPNVRPTGRPISSVIKVNLFK